MYVKGDAHQKAALDLERTIADQSTRDIGRNVSSTLRFRVLRLDAATVQLVAAIVATVAAEHPAFRAAVLYGSVARHEERALSDLAPSDVDLLLLLAPRTHEHDLSFQEHRAIFASVGRARTSVPEPPRDVQVFPTTYDLADWDEMFVENVARDGILLFARGELPSSLASVFERAVSFTTAMASEMETQP